MLFKKTLELAREAGLLKKKIEQVIDSTPMLGRGAVKDTYELLRDGIRKLLSYMDKKPKSTMNLSLKAYGKNQPKPKIDWDNKKEREKLLSILVSDTREVLLIISSKGRYPRASLWHLLFRASLDALRRNSIHPRLKDVELCILDFLRVV